MPFALIASIIIYQVLFIFIHLAVYGTLAAAFNVASLWLEAVFVLLALSFTTASLLGYRFRNRFINWFYTFSAYWFGLINFLFAGAVGFFLTANIFNYLNWYVPFSAIAGFWFGLGFLLHLYATWNVTRVQVTTESIALPDLPAYWKGKKFVFMSDIHLGSVWRNGFAKKVTQKVNALQPEVIFLGGDLFDGGNIDPAALSAPMRYLKAKHGVYFITGNHEYYVKDVPGVFAAVDQLGMRTLNNETVDIEGLRVTGLEYRATHKKEDLEAVLKTIHIDPAKPSIVLKHEPDNLPLLAAKGFSLGLFGHTHHGQIFPLTLLTKRIYKGFDYGLRLLDAMVVYTSSGAGTWGPPMRLGTRSEIVLVTLK